MNNHLQKGNILVERSESRISSLRNIRNIAIAGMAIICLWLQFLPGCDAEETAAYSEAVYNLIDITYRHASDLTGTNVKEDASAEKRAAAQILKLLDSIDTGNRYRTTLESLYGGEEQSDGSITERERSFWLALYSTGLAAGGYRKTVEGNRVILCDADSINGIAATIKQILGERAGNISPGMEAQDLWDAVCKLSLQTNDETGGEKTVEDIRTGAFMPVIGDQVFFAITFDPGEKNASAESFEKTLYGIAPGSSVTLQWCGIVVDVDDTGIARAIFGNVDLSGLGMIGNSDHPSSEGTGSVTITTRFCHNKVDVAAVKRAVAAKTITRGELTIDIPDLDTERSNMNIPVGSGGFPSVINDLEGPPDDGATAPVKIEIAQAW